VILACHGATTNFAGITTVRVLLGGFESTISPGLSLITSLWYKRSEHVSRHGIWFAGNSISSIFGGLLTYGIGHISNSVEPWRVRYSASRKLPSHWNYLFEIWLIVDSGSLLSSALLPSHMGLFSFFTYQTALAMPGSFPKKKESSSTNVPSGKHILQSRINGQKVNSLKRS
jgi:MFS family permease